MARTAAGLPGIYNSSPITLSNGDGAAVGLTSSGYTIVANSDGSNVGASTIDGATFTQNTSTGNLVFGTYQSSPDTITSGKSAAIAIDVNRNVKVTLATLISGEDLTNNVIKTEERFSYSAVALADLQVKSSAGFLHSVTISCNDAAPTAGSLIIYDNTAESGTQVFNHTFTTTPFAPFTLILDYIMTTGIYLGFTTTGDVNVSVGYR